MNAFRSGSLLRTLPLALAFAAGASAHAQKPPVKRDLSKGNTLYVIPYSHLDTQWRWAYPQVIREYIPNTMRDNLALIAKYPNYTFNFSGSRRYGMMKEYYPADYAKVAAAIKAGRWFTCGSSVDENDANVPSGESQIRHVLYGNRYFQREFGTESKEFMLPDCFGFPYALPSILAHCGITGFSTQKLTWGSAVGIPFKVGVWEGPDGKSVVAALDPGAYVGEVSEDLSQNTSWLARIRNTGAKSGAFVDYHYYGTGDRGGAPGESSVAWAEKSLAGKGPINVVSGRADEMFLNVTPAQRAKMDRYKGELLLTEHSAGSITSQAYMKRWNRKNELLADAAERASVGAMWLGASYPSSRLEKAWELVLGSQMHDILPGTSLPKAYEYSWNDEILAMNNFAEIARHGVATITAAMDTRAEGTPFVVYNPLGRAREDLVEMSLPGTMDPGTLVGPDGATVPYQVAGRKILFRAKVPANGFAVYAFRGVGAGTALGSGPIPPPDESARTIENDRLKVTIDANGDIGSVYDKTNNCEVLKAPARLDLQYHNPSAFPAWNMDWTDAQKPPYAHVGGPARIRLVEEGDIRKTIEIDRTTAGSRFVQRVSLDAGSDQVDVRTTIDWNTRETALKASFPFAHANPKATYDLQLGAIERGNNDPKKYEVPHHQWMDLTAPDGSYGAAILNDSKFGADKPTDDTMRLTLLYTPGVRGGYQDEATQDFGRHQITYSIAPHAGTWQAGEVAWKAKELNQPLKAFFVPKHDGPLGKSFSLASTDSKQVEIQALKKAEDNGETIVRLRELEGRNAKGVTLSFATPVLSAREVNGQERAIGAARVVSGKIVADVDAFSLKTYAVKLAAPKAKTAKPKSAPINLEFDVDAASTDANPGDGDFDGQGRTFPAEMLPKTTSLSDVEFRFGSTAPGAKNALTARGQLLPIPAGATSVEVLAASADGDRKAIFSVGDFHVADTVQDWRQYVGQWDNRLWLGKVPEEAFDWPNPWGGLVPGFIKPAEVAWYASHHHATPAAGRKGGNVFYEYSQIFRYRIPVPAGATTIKFPNDSAIKVFAATAILGNTEEVRPATALTDTLERAENGAPQVVVPENANMSDTLAVTLRPPLYWRAGGLRYTTDGSPVTAASPAYTDAIVLSSPTTIRVAEVDAAGNVGATTERRIEVNDTTAPRVVANNALGDLGVISLTFSERVAPATTARGNFRLSSGTAIEATSISADGRTVELTLAPGAKLAAGESLTVNGVVDLAPRGNASRDEKVPLNLGSTVFAGTTGEGEFRTAGLPAGASAPWTMNVRVKPTGQPENLTLIAGFGRARDGRNGAGRYLAKFANGIHFWSSNQDVSSTVPLTPGVWQVLTATYDGTTVRLYKDGKPIASGAASLANDEPVARIRPLDAWQRQRKFAGEIEAFTIWNQALSPRAVARLYEKTKRD